MSGGTSRLLSAHSRNSDRFSGYASFLLMLICVSPGLLTCCIKHNTNYYSKVYAGTKQPVICESIGHHTSQYYMPLSMSLIVHADASPLTAACGQSAASMLALWSTLHSHQISWLTD